MARRPRSTRSERPATDPGPLQATAAGTARYEARFAAEFPDSHFRDAFGLRVSSIGIGSYLGDSVDDVDAAYVAAVEHAATRGINVIDTAINYRCQRSERACGTAIRQVIADGRTARDELVVCSKVGYVPLDAFPPSSRDAYQAYIKREFIDTEIIQPADLVAGGHCIAPRFLRFCLAKSRQNLGLRAIDVYYLHNPGQQAAAVGHKTFLKRMREAFETLEQAAARGDIGVYGCATWDCLRTAPGTKGHVELEELAALAREVGGEAHRFRAIQLPINLAMAEAVRVPTQTIRGRPVTAVEAAGALGLWVVASATLMQGRLASNLPPTVAEHFPALRSDAQRALAFVRSLPGVATALVGMKRVEHVDENLATGR
jgi:aryl-alcohol dehydrogenase-like predicted oxidoreductase